MIFPRTAHDVGEVDAGGLDLDEHVLRAHARLGDLFPAEALRTTTFVIADGLHRGGSPTTRGRTSPASSSNCSISQFTGLRMTCSTPPPSASTLARILSATSSASPTR